MVLAGGADVEAQGAGHAVQRGQRRRGGGFAGLARHHDVGQQSIDAAHQLDAAEGAGLGVAAAVVEERHRPAGQQRVGELRGQGEAPRRHGEAVGVGDVGDHEVLLGETLLELLGEEARGVALVDPEPALPVPATAAAGGGADEVEEDDGHEEGPDPGLARSEEELQILAGHVEHLAQHASPSRGGGRAASR